jgi:cell division protein FtsA
MKVKKGKSTPTDQTAAGTPAPNMAGRSRKTAPARNIVAALDIGSSKICCFIAELRAHGGLEVIGIGHQASRGVKAGTIVDLKAAETAISHAVEAAELMAAKELQGQPIRRVFVNIPGVHTRSHQMSVNVRISSHDVSDRDIQSALAHSRSAAQHGRDELIHVIAAGYALDGQRGISDPRGMSGQSLDVLLSPVTAQNAALRNITAALHQNHLEVDAFCAAPYAAGLSTLVDDEKDLGCTVIDMGGGTTSIAVFAQGKLIYSAAIPVGGNHVTSDIARGLTTSVADAERIKTLYGAAHATSTDDGALIDVPPIGEEEPLQPNYIPKSLLVGIIQPRIEETFELVRAKLVDNGINQIAGRRVVLTGGASQLPGLCDIGQLILDKQIRLGRPQRVRGLAEATGGPSFAACAGLLTYAAEHAADETPRAASSYSFGLPFTLQGNVLQKVTSWLKENW